MAWTTPRTWGTETLTDTLLNAHVRDNLAWLHDEGGWVWVGGSTSEQTTAAGSSVDLVTISGLSIVVGRPVRIVFNFRKGSGAAAASGFGLKVNATTVLDGSTVTGTLAATSTTNQAEDGVCEVIIAPRSANYLVGMHSAWTRLPSALGAIVSGNIGGGYSAAIPNATITSLIIRANSGSASITCAVKDVHVYVGGVDGS